LAREAQRKRRLMGRVTMGTFRLAGASCRSCEPVDNRFAVKSWQTPEKMTAAQADGFLFDFSRLSHAIMRYNHGFKTALLHSPLAQAVFRLYSSDSRAPRINADSSKFLIESEL
jgi:hypothetical protein